ncbi:hypothetical protein niasHS_007232 [Heterodera schachtii]|uniref:Uncharacterized protein n=1 Tax=Heterodera schachtii TaxID=97005 RepID=A0ABD2JJR4_HETSC
MGRHRRYPMKKTAKNTNQAQKIERLSFDTDQTPLQTPKDSRKNKNMNKKPPNSMLEEQPTTWKEQMLKKMTDEVAQQKNKMQKRNKKPKNRLLEETQKLGYHHMPWESAKTLIYRIQQDQNKAINDELLKARFAKAGRDVKEIAEEYKIIDEKNKMKKERRKVLHEKQSKLRAKEKDNEEGNGANSEDEMDQNEMEEEGREDGRGGEAQEEKGTGPKESSSKRKRLRKAVKIQLKRKRTKSQATKELILNAREVIPFGDRVDAPPTFTSELARTIRPLHERAGKKELLLKRLLR